MCFRCGGEVLGASRSLRDQVGQLQPAGRHDQLEAAKSVQQAESLRSRIVTSQQSAISMRA